MNLPKRPPNIRDPQAARWADSMAVELYELNLTAELHDEGDAHQQHFVRAKRNVQEIEQLLQSVPSCLKSWAGLVRYMTNLMIEDLQLYRDDVA